MKIEKALEILREDKLLTSLGEAFKPLKEALFIATLALEKQIEKEPNNYKTCNTDVKEDIHELKTLPKYYELVRKGIKNFEVRKNDRYFKEGDILKLREWNGAEYTGRYQFRIIGYILNDIDYCKEGYVILGFQKEDRNERD